MQIEEKSMNKLWIKGNFHNMTKNICLTSKAKIIHKTYNRMTRHWWQKSQLLFKIAFMSQQFSCKEKQITV